MKNTGSSIVDLCFSDRHKKATFYGLSMYSLIHKIFKFLLFQGALPSIIDYYLLQFSDLALSLLSTEILLLSCRWKYLSCLSSFDLGLNAIPRYVPFLVNIWECSPAKIENLSPVLQRQPPVVFVYLLQMQKS